MKLTKPEIIQYLRYNLSTQTEDNFIIGYDVTKYILNDGKKGEVLVINTAVSNTDPSRKTKYHSIRRNNFSPDTSEFKVWLRDYKISILNDDEVSPFTSKENQEIEILRIQRELDSNKLKIISQSQAIQKYIDSIKVGDRVSYKNMPGIITYKHRESSPTKFTINIKDTYYKYVPGEEIFPREVADLSHLTVPEEYKKLTTKELMARLKEYQKACAPRDLIKAELQTREHIKKTKKTFIYGKD
jgi:hypothetical protein